MCWRCMLQSWSLISLSSTPPPGFGVLPNGRVPFLAAVQQIWTADLVYGHEWLPLWDCSVQGRGGEESTTCGSSTHAPSPSKYVHRISQGARKIDVIKYLGCLLAYNNNNSQAVHGNLKKAQGIWARISRTPRAANASPRVCSILHKATMQSILLFGSETWNSNQVS